MDFYWNLNFQAVNLQLVGNKTLAFLNYSDNCNFKFNYGVCIKESLIILWESDTFVPEKETTFL